MALRSTFPFAAASALAGLAFAQAPPPPPAASVTESARVVLVLLPVTVLDRKGEPVRGLTAADFEIRDEGHNVRIESVDVDERPGAGREGAPHPAAASAAVFSAPRKLVFVFDLSSPTPGELADARRAAAEFVEKRMEPGDVAAVATVGVGRHATISPRFTGDRQSIASE
ncbi:MAG TPA: hypothetical protein VG777_03815, partial [Thermoanaerobaculia bacterium]|nr:hypothetical protein [Thermoanaerobaculia bacterium]